MGFDQRDQRGDLLAELRVDGPERVAQAAHQRGVDDVPRLVSPRCSQRAVSAPARSRNSRTRAVTGLPVVLGRRRDCVAVARRPADSDRRPPHGSNPGLDKYCEPGIFDADQRGQEGRVAHQVAGPLVARPEQVAHWPG